MAKNITGENVENVCMKLAEISAATTIKYFVLNGATGANFEKIWSLRNDLQKDKCELETARNIADTTTANEHTNEKDAETIKARKAENSLIKKALESGTMNAEKYTEFAARYAANKSEIDFLMAEIKRRTAENSILYARLGETLGDGIDLQQTAFLAIWERKADIEKLLARKTTVQQIGILFDEAMKTADKAQDKEKAMLDCISQVVGHKLLTVTEEKTIRTQNAKRIKKTFRIIGKSKNGQLIKVRTFEMLGVKAIGDKAVRKIINGNRSGTAAKTTYIIVGQDENGNELLIQNSKLETMGGIDSAEEKAAFAKYFAEIENGLTARQIDIVKLLIAGFNQDEIAKKLNVKQSTISGHVQKIRETCKAMSFYKEAKKA